MVCHHLCLSPHFLSPETGKEPYHTKRVPPENYSRFEAEGEWNGLALLSPSPRCPSLPLHTASFLPGSHLLAVLDL